MVEYFPIFLATNDSTLMWVIGSIVTALTTGGGAKLIWSYWTKRESDKRAAWVKIVADKDVIIAAKDVRIEELSKELSKKSDAHAVKIEELMGVTLDKVEGWSGKLETVLSQSLVVQAEFTAEVRKLNMESGSDTGGV